MSTGITRTPRNTRVSFSCIAYKQFNLYGDIVVKRGRLSFTNCSLFGLQCFTVKYHILIFIFCRVSKYKISRVHLGEINLHFIPG